MGSRDANSLGPVSSTPDPFKVLATFAIAAGAEARIYESTWAHVLEEHGEPPDRQSAV